MIVPRLRVPTQPQKPTFWMPLYIGDYLAATSHLSTEESGAYLHLLMHEWRNGPLPADDDDMLRRITRMDTVPWSRSRARLTKFFVHNGNNELIQPQLETERAASTERRRAYQERAKKGGAATAAKRTTTASSSASSSASSGLQAVLKPTLGERTSSSSSSSSSTAKTKAPDGVSKNETPSSSNCGTQSDGSDGCLNPEKTVENTAKKDSPPSGELFEPAVSFRHGKKAAVREVFDYYCQPGQTNRNPKIYTLTPLRLRKGLARLQDALRIAHGDLAGAVELMKAVVDEVALSDWHMGRNPRTEGKSYCEWEDHLFRSTEQFEKWVQRCQEAARKEAGHG